MTDPKPNTKATTQNELYDYLHKMSKVMNYHAHLIKSLSKKVEDVKTKAYQPPLISYFDELPRRTFVIHDENRA